MRVSTKRVKMIEPRLFFLIFVDGTCEKQAEDIGALNRYIESFLRGRVWKGGREATGQGGRKKIKEVST